MPPDNRSVIRGSRKAPSEPAKWRKLLDDREIARWHGELSLSSPLTAEERLRILARYCSVVNTTPNELVRKASKPNGGSRAVHNQLQDFVIRLRNPHKPSQHGEDDKDAVAVERCARGHAPGYIANFVKAVRSWLDHNDITLRRVAIGGGGATPTVENERIPTPEQLRGVLRAAKMRGRVIIAFVAFASVRPEVLGSAKATDGLQLRDIPDLEVRGNEIRFRHVPAQIVIRRELSKVGKKYISFLPSEGCDYVKEYLEHRIARGEALGPNSPVVRPDYAYERRGRPTEMRGAPFLGRQGICQEIREALRAQGLFVRPYVLRSYAADAFLSAQREGKMTDIDREFFLGRKGAITSVYTVHKDLPASKVQALRQVFAAVEPYLGAESGTTFPGVPSELQDFLSYVARSLPWWKDGDPRFAGERLANKIKGLLELEEEFRSLKPELEALRAGKWIPPKPSYRWVRQRIDGQDALVMVPEDDSQGP